MILIRRSESASSRSTSFRSTPSAAVLAAAVLLAATGAARAAGSAWEPWLPFPDGGRTDAVATVHEGTLYVLGGRPYRCPDDLPCGDPELGAADYLPAGAGEWLHGQPFDSRLGRLGGGVDGRGRLVAFGGAQGDDPFGTDKTFIYDVVLGSETEPTLARKSFAITSFAWATDDRGRLYAIGGGPGAGASAADPNLDVVERYDAWSDTWEVLAPLPEPRACAGAVYDGQGRILVFGGYDALATTRTATVFAYTIATDTWSLLDELPAPPSGDARFTDQRAALGLDAKVYVVGGRSGSVADGTSQPTVYVFDPVRETWSFGPELATPRDGIGLALDDAGFLLALGGRADGVGLETTERLDTNPAGGDCLLAEDCDDGLGCNGAESCIDGFCVAGEPVVCDPGFVCVAGGTCRLETYTIADLGTLPGQSASLAGGINDAGVVVGSWFDTATGGYRVFRWDGALTDLGPGYGRAINDAGWIAGDDGTAFRIDPATGARDAIGTLGGSTSTAYAIGPTGAVGGESARGGSLPAHAFLWRGPGEPLEDLGTLGDYSKAHGIDGDGLVVGESLVQSFDPHAEPFLYASAEPGAVMEPMGGVYAAGSARAVNALGHVAGWSSSNVDTWGHGFLYDGATLTDLGSVPGKSYSIATAVNDAGEVVGYAFGEWIDTECCGLIWTNAIQRAVHWTGSEATNLNDVIPEDSGWVLTRAVGIEAGGRIVGDGTFDGQSRAFLMTPVAQPDGDGDGVPDLIDNCPDHANPEQADCDGDGTGDVCALASGQSTDCNGNGVPDSCDIAAGTSADVDGDGVPDECELVLAQGDLVRGQPVTFTATGALPAESVVFLRGTHGEGPGPCPPQLGGLCVDLRPPVALLGSAVADAAGTAALTVTVPASVPLVELSTQAVIARGAESVKSNAITAPVLP